MKKYVFNDVKDLLPKLEKALKPGRYLHTLGVMNTAFSLAVKHNYPAYNAMLAGLLHDCAKCISDEERIDVCKSHNIEIRPVEKKFPHLLHGKAGAVFAKEKYKISDEEILHAITYHTTGCPNMSTLDKIIYIADYIEPSRNKQRRLDEVRAAAYEDLDRCLLMILEDSVNYLSENPDMVDEMTIDTYNYYKNLEIS